MKKFALCIKANSMDPHKYTPGECYEIISDKSVWGTSTLLTMRRNNNGQSFSGNKIRFIVLPEGFDVNSKMGKLLRSLNC